MPGHRRALTAAVVLSGLVSTACGSRAAGTSGAARPGPDRATTPRAAALAFHHDLAALASGASKHLRYDCTSGGDFGWWSSGRVTRSYRTTTSRTGKNWVVELSERSGGSDPVARYRIRFDDHGYCVDRILNTSPIPAGLNPSN